MLKEKLGKKRILLDDDQRRRLAIKGKTYVIGDVNLNGDVDSVDLGALLNNFDSSSGVGWGGGDLDDDGNVNSIDLGGLLNNFRYTSAAVSAVPEPTSAWLLILAFAGLLVSARRK